MSISSNNDKWFTNTDFIFVYCGHLHKALKEEWEHRYQCNKTFKAYKKLPAKQEEVRVLKKEMERLKKIFEDE